MQRAEAEVVAIAAALGAEEIGGPLSGAERRWLAFASGNAASRHEVAAARQEIRDGLDPLGSRLCDLRSVTDRRSRGMFYTPPTLVDAMTTWIALQKPDEAVDCGSGTGRFSQSLASLKKFPVYAVDTDAVACLLHRATLNVRRLRNVTVINGDFTTLALPSISGTRAFVGNPPYVRHHDLSPAQKQHGQGIARSLGIRLSGLAGLHAHFFFAVARLSQPGDVLCFLTSSEWLDVNYGDGIRKLMLDGLRAENLHVLDPAQIAFDDAATTSVIVCARAGGENEYVRFRWAKDLEHLTSLDGGTLISRSVLQHARAWGRLARLKGSDTDDIEGSVPLGSFARVHRGAVTGSNDFFVMNRERARSLGLQECVRPVVASAQEVLSSGGILSDGPGRKVVLCPPSEESLSPSGRRALRKYLRQGEALGIDQSYVCSHRKPWWRPQFKDAPPIVATYMTRQAPSFALNPDGLCILNVIHGIYPRAQLYPDQLGELCRSLNEHRESYRGRGRVYQGGLEKFEPSEMELLPVRLKEPGSVSMLCDV